MKTHLQVIDAEVVLTNLILPNETVLLPFKDVAYDICGASLLEESVEALSVHRNLILSGYIDLFALIFRKQETLLEALNLAINNTPIRVIVRNTRVYTNHMSGNTEVADLLLEEDLQIKRGDIPYFFKRLKDQKLMWISSSNRNIEPIENLGSFKTDVDRHARDPAELIGDLNKLEVKMAQGAFLIQKKLGSDASNFLFNGKMLALTLNEFNNEYTGSQFRNSSPKS